MSPGQRIPRVLATRLLHLAQTASASGVRGVVLAGDDGGPGDFATEARDDAVWAVFLGRPASGPAPDSAEVDAALRTTPRVLVAALDVAGVLRLDLYEREAGATVRRAVGILPD